MERAELSKKTVKQLQDLCRESQLRVSGKKRDLIERLLESCSQLRSSSSKSPPPVAQPAHPAGCACMRCSMYHIDPFHTVLDVYGQEVDFGNAKKVVVSDRSRSQRFNFKIRPKESHSYLLVSAKHHPKRRKWTIAWPTTATVKIDGVAVHTRARPNYGHAAKQPILDMSRHIGSNSKKEKNIIIDTCIDTEHLDEDTNQIIRHDPNQKFFVGIIECTENPWQSSSCLEEGESVESAVQRMKESKFMNITMLTKDEGAKFVGKVFASEDEDLQEVDQVLSLLCPFGYMKAEIPARGRNCQHIRCFDVGGYFATNKGAQPNNRWCCPICNAPIGVDLVVDLYILDVSERKDELCTFDWLREDAAAIVNPRGHARERTSPAKRTIDQEVCQSSAKRSRIENPSSRTERESTGKRSARISHESSSSSFSKPGLANSDRDARSPSSTSFISAASCLDEDARVPRGSKVSNSSSNADEDRRWESAAGPRGEISRAAAPLRSGDRPAMKPVTDSRTIRRPCKVIRRSLTPPSVRRKSGKSQRRHSRGNRTRAQLGDEAMPIALSSDDGEEDLGGEDYGDEEEYEDPEEPDEGRRRESHGSPPKSPDIIVLSD